MQYSLFLLLPFLPLRLLRYLMISLPIPLPLPYADRLDFDSLLHVMQREMAFCLILVLQPPSLRWPRLLPALGRLVTMALLTLSMRSWQSFPHSAFLMTSFP